MTRLLVVGAGAMGRRHAALIGAHPQLTLAGFVDPSPPRAAFPGTPSWPDIASVTAEVDGAVIATPNADHAASGIACAARGWPILVEKPIASTLGEAEALITAAEAARVPLLVGHHRRHHPAAGAARSLIAAGAIGRLVGVEALWALRKPDAYFAGAWRTSAGGGPVLLNLIHEIDLLRHLAGEIVEVAALTSAATRGGAVEDTAALALRFQGGALGTVLLSDAALSPWAWEAATGENPAIAHSGRDSWRLSGTEGALAFPSLTLWRYEGEGEANWSRPLSSFDLSAGPGEALALQLDHFRAVILGEAEPLVSGRDGLATLRATLAVHASARTGAAIRLGD
ncbi:MAG TPA: Gfo/Idh/MocA family oxidoreductase [Paracoccaceae bacterium]|nr:Gfo/Idh/MocA family oxidoreductase [Paracoccaceae bacterium]